MKISLNFSAEAMEKMKQKGFDPVTPEVLTWAEHGNDADGIVYHPNPKADGVVLRGSETKSMLDGSTFAALVNNLGAWIEVDSDDARAKVAAAVASTDADTDKAVKVA
jgi:hypothetical protein